MNQLRRRVVAGNDAVSQKLVAHCLSIAISHAIAMLSDRSILKPFERALDRAIHLSPVAVYEILLS